MMNGNLKAIKYFMLFNIFIIPFCVQNLIAQEPEVRVLILKSDEPVKLNTNGSWKLETGSTEKVIDDQSSLIFNPEKGSISLTYGSNTLSGSIIRLSSIDSENTVDIFNVPYGVGWWWEGKEDRNYEGDLIFRSINDSIEVIVSLPVEKYLKGVIPYEIGGDSPLEALKAQAVAARSEAFAALSSGLYGGEYHDLTSDVECQVFSGNKKRTENSDKAVNETRAIILTENGEVINAYYSSSCGGHSEEIKYVWPDRPRKESYMVSGRDWSEDEGIDLSDEINVRNWILSNPDSYCNPNGRTEPPSWSKKNYRWAVDFSNEKISHMFSDGDYGMLQNIVPLERGASGRISKAKFIFDKKEITAESELEIRLLFTPPLRSSCFIFDKDEEGFHFKGAGWGHGVGMCQTGAIAMAKRGKKFDDILLHYYKKARLKNIY